jgi:hypothetical protein
VVDRYVAYGREQPQDVDELADRLVLVWPLTSVREP